jgi:hypothetical protein
VVLGLWRSLVPRPGQKDRDDLSPAALGVSHQALVAEPQNQPAQRGQGAVPAEITLPRGPAAVESGAVRFHRHSRRRTGGIRANPPTVAEAHGMLLDPGGHLRRSREHTCDAPDLQFAPAPRRHQIEQFDQRSSAADAGGGGRTRPAAPRHERLRSGRPRSAPGERPPTRGQPRSCGEVRGPTLRHPRRSVRVRSPRDVRCGRSPAAEPTGAR